MRSFLFVPAHNRKLLDSAIESDADVLLLDVEDSVQPVENKKIARNNIAGYLTSGRLKDKILYPRINDRESGHLLKDLNQLTIPGISGFMYPKSYSGEDIYFIDKLLETIEYEKGFKIGTFKLIPLIETCAAVLNVQDICKASKRIVAIAFGSEDFITDLEATSCNYENLLIPRSMIAMAAHAHNIIAIDTVHIDVHNLQDLEEHLRVAKNLGFEGKLVLHPKELPLVHQYFSPSDTEIENAKEILLLAGQAEKEGKGVAIKNKKFIGPPAVLAAKKVLKKAKE